ncbi:MAG: ABC transporter permease [Deltaproteobacteria bacterium]|nr:ABC transporter permease [Deltaproteobacteria bacterium]
MYVVYIIAFLLFLFVPLIINGIIAFNNDEVPSFPWRGATLDWFYSTNKDHVGVFNDPRMIRAIGMSMRVALLVTAFSLVAGTTSSFLFIRENFRGKQVLYLAIIAPLVIPGIILGISILVFFHGIIGVLKAFFGPHLARPIVRSLRPGFLLVVLGQFSFIGTIATLVISARLRKFPIELEEAAMDLGSSRWGAIFSVTLPYLLPALFSAGILAFLLSFENFSTTLFLIGAKPTLPIFLYSKLRFFITPEINAISVILMGGTALLGLIGMTMRSGKEVG